LGFGENDRVYQLRPKMPKIPTGFPFPNIFRATTIKDSKMGNFLKEIQQLFDSYETTEVVIHLETHSELISQKASLIINLLKAYEYAWEIVCERKKDADFWTINRYRQNLLNDSDQNKLFSEIIDRKMKEPSGFKSPPKIKTVSSEEMQIAFSAFRSKQIETTKLFLKADYEPPILNPDSSRKPDFELYQCLSDHLFCLYISYYAFLQTKKHSTIALHRLDIAAMKLIPLIHDAIRNIKESEPIKYSDRKIKGGRTKRETHENSHIRQLFIKIYYDYETFPKSHRSQKIYPLAGQILNIMKEDHHKKVKELPTKETAVNWIKSLVSK
jgi:hypothetical protein